MKHARGVLLGAGLSAALLVSIALTPTAVAQDATGDTDVGDEKRHFGLYVGFGYGNADADDLDVSIETTLTNATTSVLQLTNQDHARASIGWRFDEGKGDVRLTFTGFKETEYALSAIGSYISVASGQSATGLLPWWELTITDGALTATRTVPQWTIANDANGNSIPDPDEVTFGAPNRTVTGSGPGSLQNQIQTVDVMYGREFGTRRVTSHWWAGLRQFSYEGNLIGGAWLSSVGPGTGFTDGALLNPLIFYTESSGTGPTGAWGADFNFFDKGLQLYVQAQSSFVFTRLDVDSGEFFTITRPSASSANTLAPARLADSRDKSSWQNSIEGGIRLNFRNGLQFEAAYTRYGYLDTILRPFDLAIPESPNQAAAGTSALFNTQDLIFDAWRAGIAYQF